MKRIRPHWRKMTWALVIWTVIFALWIFFGIHDAASSVASDCAKDSSVTSGILTQQECEDASNAGTGIGAALVFVFWFLGFIPLSLTWFMTRPREKHIVYVERAQ